MFESLMKQVRAVTTITGHMGGQISSMHGQLMIGALNSPVLGAQILLGDVSRLLDALEFIPETDEFDFGFVVDEDFDINVYSYQIASRLEVLGKDVEWMEEAVAQLVDALNVVDYQIAQLTDMVGQLSNLAAGAKDTEAMASALAALKDLILPELLKLDEALNNILEVYQAEVERRRERIWRLDSGFRIAPRLKRRVRKQSILWSKRIEAELAKEREEAGEGEASTTGQGPGSPAKSDAEEGDEERKVD